MQFVCQMTILKDNQDSFTKRENIKKKGINTTEDMKRFEFTTTLIVQPNKAILNPCFSSKTLNTESSVISQNK